MEHDEIYIPSHAGERTKGKVVIIYTGGTFGMHYNAEGVLVPFDFGAILDQLPMISRLALDLTVVSFRKPVDSSNIQPEHWMEMATIVERHYSQSDGFVILHGTDTMAYTASALSFMLTGLSKPVVLTGAQLPISEPRSDARENLINALEIASARRDGKPVVPEVSIYFNNELLRGNRTRKTQSMQFDAFDSGNYPALATAGVVIEYNWPVLRRGDGGQLVVLKKFDVNVAVLQLFPGITEAFVKSVLATADLKALILETFGSGTVPGLPWFYTALEKSIARGLIVLNVSQCPGAQVIQGRYESSKRLLEIGVLSGGDMTLEAACTKLMLLLGEYGAGGVKDRIGKSLAGEISE